MRFAALVGYLGVHVKFIINRTVDAQAFWIVHGNANREGSLVVCRHGACRHLLPVLTTPPEPAETLRAVDGIFDLRALYGHTRIGCCHTSHADGVAGLVRIFIFIKRHLEGRTLVFFYLEGCTCAAVIVRCVHGDGEGACQTLRGKREVNGSCSEVVGRRGLLRNFLVVGIAEREGQRRVFPHVGAERLLVGVPHHSCHVNVLSRPVDGTVRIGGDAFGIVNTLPIGIIVLKDGLSIGLVVSCPGIDESGTVLLVSVDDLAVPVRREGVLYALS